MNGKRHSRTAMGLMVAAGVAAGLLVPTQSARAGGWSFSIGAGGHGGSYVGASYGEFGYGVAARDVWVEPVYVGRRVRVRAPAVVRTREVPVYDRYGDVVDYRVVDEIAEPAYYAPRARRVLVRDGYYRTAHRPIYRSSVYRRHGGAAIRVAYDRYGSRGHYRGHYRGHRRGLRVGFGIRH